MVDKQTAIKFFEEQIYQYKGILGGLLSPNYRNYVEKVVDCYSLSVELLRESEDNHDL